MNDDIVTRLRDLREVLMGNPIMAGEVQEAMDEIERLRAEELETFILYRKTIEECNNLRRLIKAFVHQWEQDEIGKGNGTDYFHAVHAMREAVRGE